MNPNRAEQFVTALWDRDIIPRLIEYIRIPCKSPHFDPAWEANGYIEQAIQLAALWCRRQPIEGMTVEIVRLPKRTPLLFIEVPGNAPGTVLLYGHGHTGVDLSVMNNVQFLEPALVSPVGASGGFLDDARPATYRRALDLIESGIVDPGPIVTHRYTSLDAVPDALGGAHRAPDYVKGVVELPER